MRRFLLRAVITSSIAAVAIDESVAQTADSSDGLPSRISGALAVT
jgi:hypothetical protein